MTPLVGPIGEEAWVAQVALDVLGLNVGLGPEGRSDRPLVMGIASTMSVVTWGRPRGQPR